MNRSRAARIVAPVMLLASGGVHAVDYFGPTPYLSLADTPVQFSAGVMVLEDGEDGTIDPRLTIPLPVALIGPGGNTDSVDADDGVINGSGTNGRSLFRLTPLVEVDFAQPFPQAAGLVWTDGGLSTSASFEAFGADGQSLGVYGPFTLGDASTSGTTAEDRFFGARDDGGISRLRISHTSGGIEIDHIQFSVVDALFAHGFEAVAPTVR